MNCSHLQGTEASKTCVGVSCILLRCVSHVWGRSSHLKALGGGKLYLEASGVPLCGDPLACSCHQGWVGGRTWWGASYIDHHCVASLPHVLVGCSHHSGLEEDMICLEASCIHYCCGSL